MDVTNAMPLQAPRIHGGPDRFGAALHDFSTNSNACAPCPMAQAAVQKADASQYPDASYSALRQQLANFHGVDPYRVVLAASASEFIFRITALIAQTTGQGDTVWLPPHSYGDYAQAAHAHKLVVAAEPADAQLLWACEPSSPLGLAQAGLDEMAHTLVASPPLGGVEIAQGGLSPRSFAGPDTLCVLDRAYEPLRLSGAPTLTTAQLQTVWQLWTPNKALGLTGVRAAYAIAPMHAEATVVALDQLSPSWPVGAHGVALLQAWTRPDVQAWLAESLVTLRHWKARQIDVCESLGWVCLPSDANFFCAKPVLPQGLSLQEALARLRTHSIKLRDTTSFGLPGHVRVSVQPPAAQTALKMAWTSLTAIKN
ncbi:aminotransferase class I/II-fold pyridoxal phosphate-dependent enzyme [Polaromonas sp. CG_9.5]|uniref:aminotransferase class I/II-fold pyridoxal phosphate-dependent enzyme n=1 Tax=Polaromonas sp. CG_9.5 TaxID=3071705 RepID=UPI002E0D4B37